MRRACVSTTGTVVRSVGAGVRNQPLGWTMLLVLALFLAACGSTEERSDEGAVVEERGLSADELAAQAPDASSRPYSDDAGEFRGNALDDPSSLLSTRIIYFEYDSAEIRSDYQAVIEAHAKFLASRPNTIVTLEGHADERGSREYNLALGERRAQAVRRLMALMGASAGQIRTVSYGEERPVQEGHDESSYSLNRRVELVY
jgi:peptidoglycan-associated lipoprotein